MIEADAHSKRKADRELRLQWQSRLLLAAVLLPAAAGLIWRALPALTPIDAEGLVICAAFGLLVRLLRAATPWAAVAGFVLTSGLFLGSADQPDGSWFHTALLPGLALFVLAFASTRFRRGQKERSGLAEARSGRRASQVAANMGVAALVAIFLPTRAFGSGESSFVYAGLHMGHFAFGALVAALAEAAADTVSSEVGQAIGGIPFLVTSWRRVPAGTDGAVTLAGTVSGGVAAAIVVFVAIPTLRLDTRQALIAWIAAIGGLFADSLIGATFEEKGWLNNDIVNFVSTAVAALMAVAALAL